MSDVTVKLNWNGGSAFTGLNSSGHETVIDGDKKSGASPVELLLEALGACSAIDVVIIMEKVRTPLQRLEVTLEGLRHSPEPRYYTDVRVNFDAWGEEINPDKLARAIYLSFAKYCSVYHSLRPDMKLQTGFRIHSSGAEAGGEYQPVEIRVLSPES
jgi:putative redox protein